MKTKKLKETGLIALTALFMVIFLASPAMATGEFEVSRTISDTLVKPGDTITVEVVFKPNQKLVAPSIVEYLPTDWEVTDIYLGAVYKHRETYDEWIWAGDVPAGQTRTARYTLTVPASATDGTYTISGICKALDRETDKEVSISTENGQITVSSTTTASPVTAEFTSNVTSGNLPLSVKFADMSTNATSWQWDFDGDGSIDSAEQNPVHTYTTAGTYTVKLTASGTDDSDSKTKTDYISVTSSGPSLDASFTANVTSGDSPLSVKFTDLSSGGATSWQWDFNGDGSIDSTEQNPVHTYPTAGTYTVKLTASDGDDSDSETKTNYIYVTSSGSSLDAGFTSNITSGEAPLSVKFTDLSSGDVSSWQWDFDGDGSIDSTKQNPVYIYNEKGYYTVKLTVYDNDGNSDSLTEVHYITVGDDDIYNSYEATAVSLSATIIPAISIEVTPGALDFGTLSAGETSEGHTLRIKNKGATDSKVTAQVTDVAKGLYEDGLMLNSGNWDGYSNVVESETTETVQASLQVPDDYIGIGSMEGKLVFWAEVS